MTFLPIVERELRVAARQLVTHRMRLGAAAFALIIWFLLSVFGNMTSPQRAQAIFGTISILSLGFAMLTGSFLTADCLSEERREGTLGLLFLTDLKGHDVVLGKLASTSLHTIYGLLAVVPMLAVPLLMGGVTPGEFARTALVLLTTLFLSLSAGMFVSSVNEDSRAAFLRTLGIMVLLSGVLPLLWWGQWVLLRPPTFDPLLWTSPGYALRCAGDAFYSTRSGAGEFWSCLIVIGTLGILFLTAASVLLPRVWRQTRSEGNKRGVKNPTGLKRREQLRALLESRPYFWLAARDNRMGRWASWVIGVALLVWFAFYLHSGSTRPGGASFTITFLMAFALHVFFKCMVITEATRRLSEDRQSGALELLLVTPLRPTQIIAGQKAALTRLFRWPKWMLVGMNLLLILLALLSNGSRLLGPDWFIFMSMFGGGIVLLLADCLVIGPAGVWSALTTKRHTRAIFKTVRQLLLPSWAAILLFWFFAVTSNGISSGTVQVLVVMWVILGLAVDAIALAVTTRRLKSDFRELAATGQARPVRPEMKAGS